MARGGGPPLRSAHHFVRDTPTGHVVGRTDGSSRHHFATMGLAELYATQAASELADISYALADVGNSAGTDGVRAHLAREL